MTDLIKNFASYKLSALLGIIFLAAALGHANAQDDVQKIASIVNDEIISEYDVQQRVNLIVFSSGMQASAEDIKRMRAQVLRSLVDETLKIQEARRLEVEITRGEVDQSIEGMARQNNTTVEEIKNTLVQSGTNITTLRRQIAADLAWETIVRGMFSSRVSVSPDEVETIFQRNSANINQPQYHVGEIYFRVDSPDQDGAVLETAQNVLQQLRAGASFSVLAQQFSQSASAAKGGDIGWIQDGQLAPEINEVLRELAVGQISEPVRTINAYHILTLRNRRVVGGAEEMLSKLNVRQMIFPLAPETPEQELMAAGQYLAQITTQIRSCAQLDDIQKQLGTGQVSPAATVVAKELPSRFRDAILPLKVGQATPPMLSQQGFHIVVLCGREESVGRLPSREEIDNQLTNQQISMMARRFLRDLRNDAVVEYR